MLYSLSISTIADTIHALAAMELLRAGEDEKTLLSPLLDAERSELLSQMIKTAFAEISLTLLPYVEDIATDNESLDLSLRTPVFAFDGIHLVLRRKIEAAVAYKVIQTYILSAASSADFPRTDYSELVDVFAKLVADAEKALLSALIPSFEPFVRGSSL